jgi:hypothetical protein
VAKSAATGTAADGSTTTFMRSQVQRIASTIAASSTVTRLHRCAERARKVRSASGAFRPSAIVSTDPGGCPSRRPAASERAASAARAGSAPTTASPGAASAAASATPLARPPPPTGTTTASRSGTSSSSSSSTVPCPAITAASS